MRGTFIFPVILLFCLVPVWTPAQPDLMDSEAFENILQQASDQYRKGEFQKALESEGEVLRMAQQRYGLLHPLVAQVFGDLGEMQSNLAQYAEAEKSLKWSLAVFEKNLGQDAPPSAAAMERLAGLYEDMALYQDALYFGEKAVAIRNEKGTTDEWAESLVRLGRLKMESGDTGAAEKDLSQAVSLVEKSHGFLDIAVVHPLQARVELWVQLEKWDDAKKDLERILEITRNKYTGMGPQTADVLKALGDFYRSKKDAAKSKEYYEQALKIYRVVLTGNQGYAGLEKMEKIAAAYRGIGAFKDALEWDTKATELEKAVYGPEHPRFALSEARVAWDEDRLGEHDKAKADRSRAKVLLAASLGEAHPLTQSIERFFK